MKLFARLFARPWLRAWVVAAVTLSAAALVWIGYRAVSEWQRAAATVASRRAESAVDLLMTALTRDMHGAQETALRTADRNGLVGSASIDLLPDIMSAFSMYPYVECFFAASGTPSNQLEFYSRAERMPAWLPALSRPSDYPVVLSTQTEVASRLASRVMKDAAQGRGFSVFDLEIASTPYQIVTVISYADALKERPRGILGFMVNLTWTRAHYFEGLTDIVSNIEGGPEGLRFAMADEAGAPVVGALPPPGTGAPVARREFPMTFFDPLLVALDPPRDLELATWTAMTLAAGDPTLMAAERSARRTLALASLMAVVLIAGLVLSLQAGRANARLTEMRSDFVSAVTHELKTPIANLRAIHETVASGRVTHDVSREYAAMGVREATRLTRLVENLLAYARITDVADAYAFEPVSIAEVVERSVQEFASHLTEGGFAVSVDVPDLSVRADPTALELMLNNLIDNAIRYSADTRVLSIGARDAESSVVLTVADRGNGIPEEEKKRVMKKFFRGRHSRPGGSGLGLAIVERIVRDHGGTVEIQSAPGAGTSVVVTLPKAG
jgi:signal transduction histidine kinase